MLVATLIWSVVCVTTLLFARATHSLDYQTFFARMLGPLRFVLELAFAPAHSWQNLTRWKPSLKTCQL
jgi:hypothetical protein